MHVVLQMQVKGQEQHQDLPMRALCVSRFAHMTATHSSSSSPMAPTTTLVFEAPRAGLA